MRAISLFMRMAVVGSSLCLLGPTARTDEPPLGAQELRYDGKPFAYWRDYARTELKPERRVEAIRALAAFAVRGRASESAQAIVSIVKEYGEDAHGFSNPEPTPEQRLIKEARDQVLRLGSPGVDALIQSRQDRNVRLFALLTYDRLSEDKIPISDTSLRALLEAIQGKDPELRSFAAEFLNRGLARDENLRTTALSMAETGGMIGPVVEGLSRLLREDCNANLENIFKTLGPRAKKASGALIWAALHHRSFFSIPTEQLKSLEVPETEILAALADALDEPGPRVRDWAATWLGEFGPRAQSALPKLIKLFKDGDVEVRLSAIQATGLIASKPELCVPALVEVISNPDPLPDAGSGSKLQPIAPRSQSVLMYRVEGKLIDPLTDSKYPRLAAMGALAKFGGQAKDAATAIVKVMANEEEEITIRAAAARIAGQLENPQAVVPALIKFLDTRLETKIIFLTSDQPAACATISLAYLVSEVPAAGAALVRAFRQCYQDDRFRDLLVRTMGEIGPPAHDALPELEKALKDPDPQVRRDAAAAIERINRKAEP